MTEMASPPFDLASLNEMLGTEETEDILRLFVETSEPLLEKIAQAIENHDGRLLKEAAHELKGSSSSIGAQGLAAPCFKLEMAARNNEWFEVEALNKAINESFQIAKVYIEALY